MDVRRLSRGFDRRERLEDPIAMFRAGRDEPGIARLQHHHLTFQVEFGAPADHIADGLLVAAIDRLIIVRPFGRPQGHGDALARNEILLTEITLGRVLRTHLFHACVRHCSSTM